MTHTQQHDRSDLEGLLGTIGDAMTEGVVTLPPELPAAEAIAMLERRGVGGAPVVERDRVIGVVTVADLAALEPRAQRTGPFLRPPRGRTTWTVRDAMTESVLTAAASEPLVDAVVRMDEAKVDRLPVVDAHGRAIGILARGDVVRALARTVRSRDDSDLHPAATPHGPRIRPLLPPD